MNWIEGQREITYNGIFTGDTNGNTHAEGGEDKAGRWRILF